MFFKIGVLKNFAFSRSEAYSGLLQTSKMEGFVSS